MSRVVGGKGFAATPSLLHRRGRSFNGGGSGVGAVEDHQDEILDMDLFSRGRAGAGAGGLIGSTAGSDGHDELVKPDGESKREKSGGIDDLLDSTEMGKHDYDWLLTPPGTPHLPPSDGIGNENPSTAASCNENPSSIVMPKRNLPVRSVSVTRTSRLSASQTENGSSVRPTRSSSVTRASISSSRVSNSNKSNSLSSSSASVTSRPSTPGRRPTTPSGKPATLASRPAPARSSTPIKARPTTSAGTRAGPSENARPTTPNSRSRTSTNSISSSSTVTRTTSRPSTPTRQPISRIAASGQPTGQSPSVGRIPASNIRTPQSAPSSRASSPSPRPRTPVRPIDLPDFPTDVPPNLRTKLPERPLSAGRARPGALTVRTSQNEAAGLANSNRRTSFPVVARSKFPENPSRGPLQSNGHHPEKPKTMLSDVGSRKTTKSANTAESTGFGRTISKSSLDMALRHMDIRQSLGGIRGVTLFPQSIRTVPSKARATRTSEPVVPVSTDENVSEGDSCNDTISCDTNGVSLYETNSITKSLDRAILMSGESLNDLDLYGSRRYESMLLREDPKSTNWLHNVDDKSDQGSVFDHRFEPLPELFDPL